jgi:hypothetical protein
MDSDLEQLGERIAEQAAHLDAAMYRFLTDLREFDERGGWHTQGALSCAHWLNWRVGWDLVTGRERVRVARKLGEFAVIGDALRRGEVSYSKVRALLRVATPENEALLLDHARLMTASQLEKLSRKYALVQRHGQDPHPLGDAQRRCVRRRDTEDGMVKIEAVLHPEEAELVWTMLNHAATQLTREPAIGDSAEAGAAAQRPRDAGTQSASTPSDAGDGRIDDSAEAGVAGQGLRDAVPGSASDAGDGRSDDSAEAGAAGQGPTDAGTQSTSTNSDVGDGWSDDSAESLDDTEPTSRRGPSVLHQRADAAKRGFHRADALVSIAQGYLRGDRPQRSPIEITVTIPQSGLRAWFYRGRDGTGHNKRPGGEVAAMCDARGRPSSELPSAEATMAAGAHVGAYAVIAWRQGYVGFRIR